MDLLRHHRRTARPISRYALWLIGVLVVALGVLGGVVFHDTDRLREQVVQADLKYAQQELKEAIALLNQQAAQTADALVQWDEARQQLGNPLYYAYWRNSRALSAGVVPGGPDALDLYDVEGRSLSAETAGVAKMPAQIDPQNLKAFLLHENGQDHLLYFFPFYQDATRSRVLGYIGIKFNFLEQIVQLRRFRYLDLKTVRVVAPNGVRIPPEDIVSKLTFRPIANPDTRALETIITRSFYEVAAILSLVALVGYLAFVSILTQPLRRLSMHIDSMRRGKGAMLGASYQGVLVVTELENVRQSLNDYQQQLDDMHVDLADKNKELWSLAHRDPLTGIFNRRAFDDDWAAMCRTHRDTPLGVAFLLIDCDHFKAINDTYGHQVGDQVLQGMAQSLQEALRAEDRLYRLGGDEFATVLFSADVQRATEVAERCMMQLQTFDFTAYGVKEPVRASVGIAYLDVAYADALQQLHRQADLAMYHAKRPGQLNIAVYNAEMGASHDAVVSNAETSAVYEAMADVERIEMHYQPVMSLSTSHIDYYEALVRIRGEHSLIMPSSIFPVVELRGLEAEFDLSVIERVRRDLESGRIPAGAGVSINVSGPGIVNARVNEKLLEYRPLFAKYKLVLEVTETALITRIAHASANLGRLRKEGFEIALDDFGSGYSSLRYLSNMPVDLVKFDISMVRALEEPGRQALLVEDLSRMIKDAGYRLVAEGIETEALLKRVTALGFSHGQGFYIGRPASLDSSSFVS